MNSRERILAACNGQPPDHVPLTTWCFGFQPPPHLRWQRNSREVRFWYSKRLEHIHTLPQPWELEDDFQRVLAWRALGVDDLLEVSVPWSMDPEVTWQDSRLPAGTAHSDPVLVREYHTPSGTLRHAVRQTALHQEEPGEGWVVQSDYVALFEDLNLPRANEQAVHRPSDIAMVKHLYKAPDNEGRDWFASRMQAVSHFASENSVAVQAWPAFGIDAVVWLAGAEGAVLSAMEYPEAFQRLVETVAEADYGRTKLAAAHPAVDIIVQRGWYASTNFWSPRLFNKYMYPHIKTLASLAHQHGKKYAYVMTTGVEAFGPLLAEAGVDILYFVDPVQDRITLERARELLGDRMTLVGGINSLSLASGDRQRIRWEVQQAIRVLGPTHRFILHPVDALFPDTPWSGVETMIEAWQETR